MERKEDFWKTKAASESTINILHICLKDPRFNINMLKGSRNFDICVHFWGHEYVLTYHYSMIYFSCIFVIVSYPFDIIVPMALAYQTELQVIQTPQKSMHKLCGTIKKFNYNM